MKNSKKEALKQFLEEWLKNQQAKRMKDKEEDKDKEVCIEPFVFLDEEGNVVDYKLLMEDEEELAEFMNLYDVLDAEVCPSVEDEPCTKEEEEEEEYMPLDGVQLSEEELEYYKSVAENIKPINPDLVVPCVVNGEERTLVDGLNCNIKQLPILGVSLISPLNLEVLKVVFDSDMESESEMEVHVVLRNTKQKIVYKFTLGLLLDNGLLAVVDNAEVELSAVEYRGITKEVDAEELVKLFTFTV